MNTFFEFSKSRMLASWAQLGNVPPGLRGVPPIDLIREEMQGRKNQCSRLSAYIVRVVVGNEITDYQLPYQPGEILWVVDYNRLSPVAKFFGRFKGGRFTGLKYNYSYFFADNQSHQYIDSIAEYRDGRPCGVQVYFNARGEVTHRRLATETAGQSLSTPAVQSTP